VGGREKDGRSGKRRQITRERTKEKQEQDASGEEEMKRRNRAEKQKFNYGVWRQWVCACVSCTVAKDRQNVQMREGGLSRMVSVSVVVWFLLYAGRWPCSVSYFLSCAYSAFWLANASRRRWRWWPGPVLQRDDAHLRTRCGIERRKYRPQRSESGKCKGRALVEPGGGWVRIPIRGLQGHNIASAGHLQVVSVVLWV
jgi:hypothetical protein